MLHKSFGLLKLSDNKGLSLFLIKLIAVYFSWKGIIFFLGKEEDPIKDRFVPFISRYWEALNDFFRIVDLKLGQWVLSLFSYDAIIHGDYHIYVKGHHAISWGNYCIGFQLSYYFTFLVLISPIKSYKLKGVSIFLGFILVRLLNNFRMTGMNLISVHWPEYLALSHHYIFNLMVLLVLILYYNYLVKKHVI